MEILAEEDSGTRDHTFTPVHNRYEWLVQTLPTVIEGVFHLCSEFTSGRGNS